MVIWYPVRCPTCGLMAMQALSSSSLTTIACDCFWELQEKARKQREERDATADALGKEPTHG